MEEIKDFSKIETSFIECLQLKYQEDIRSKPTWLQAELLETIENIPFIYNLVKADRKRACDIHRDSFGRIIVNLTEPHVLENMDFFREAAIRYKETGRYTDLYPNPDPNSEYILFWKEEERRCIEGYVRPHDGEWITGYYYWYLNYNPILVTKESDTVDKALLTADAAIRADRVEDFPAIWDGDYLYYHYIEQAEQEGKFGTVLKTRGRGYSFKGASNLTRNYFHVPKSKSYAMASVSDYLTDDGILSKAWANLSFIDNNTAWTKARDYKDTDTHKRASYKDPKTKTEKGRMAEIMGVTLANKPEKARGKRGKIIEWEEAGIFPNLLKSWGIARASLEDGDYVFGFMVAFGTGGTEGADFDGMKALFYEPRGYRVKAIKNVFDKNASSSECAFYLGEYMNRKDCYDKNGNSDPIKALSQLYIRRKEIRDNTTDPNALIQEKADRSITPQEAVMRREGSLFPVQDLKEYLTTIEPNLSHFTAGHHIGKFQNVNGVIKWDNDILAYPIREFPLKDNKKEGAIEIFQHPVKGAEGTVPFGRYIAGCDSYDHDDSTTTSLGSLFILDTVTDEIVLEYTGRPRTADEFYENVLRCIEYYNAILNYENFNKGLFAYFSNKNATWRLSDVPRILKQMEFVKGDQYGNKSKGTPPGTSVNALGRSLYNQYLLKPAFHQDYDEEGNQISSFLNLHKIRSIGLIKESIQWNIDGNFDRVSAIGMLMILREDRINFQIDGQSKAPNPDNYWTRNYKKKNAIYEKLKMLSKQQLNK